MESSWPSRAKLVLGRQQRRRRRLRRREKAPSGIQRQSVRRKLRELETLVPGGEGLRADQLFVRTADYILHLRLQVKVLHTFSKFYMP